MKKFLVPTDFSDTSKNAARYAVQLATQVPGANIILYNVYDKIAAGSDGTPLTESETDRRTILNQALKNLEIELHEESAVKIDFVAEEGNSLVDNISRYVRYHGIDMVIMGITGATRLEQIFMGSNTLNMVNEAICPVLIVPPNATFRKIENVMLASDFKDVKMSTPITLMINVLNMFKPNLHIVNVDSEHYVELTEDYKFERAKLELMFRDFNPQFSFIRMFDFLDAISSFTADRNIDLIMTIPKRHSFLTSFFKTSHTKKLAYHSHVPIVAIHE
jgi:nucleotide-binding universal stress UspA family protein